MKSTLLILLFAFISLNLEAQYRYVIYTDQESSTGAQEVISLFQQTEPFNEFDLEFEIRPLTTAELGCDRPYEAVPRVIECDTLGIMQRAFNDGFDQAMVVSDSDTYGGAAGTVPVMSSANEASTMIHEYMHVLGFCDEYHFTTEDEANLYCIPERFRSYLNATIIEPLAGGYTGDDHARSTHSNEIPWYSNILPTTPIATQVLGTPGDTQGQLGLFESQACVLATDHRFRLWKPGNAPNIMQSLEYSIGEYVPLVRDAMESLTNPRVAEPQSNKPIYNRTELHTGTNCPSGSTRDTQPLTRQEQMMMKDLVLEFSNK